MAVGRSETAVRDRAAKKGKKVGKMKKQITIEIETEFTHEEIEQTVNELCAKGINKGCYQNYAALMEVLSVVSQAEMHYERTVAKK